MKYLRFLTTWILCKWFWFSWVFCKNPMCWSHDCLVSMAILPTYCDIIWFPRKCYPPIVTSQRIFTVIPHVAEILFSHIYSPKNNFMSVILHIITFRELCIDMEHYYVVMRLLLCLRWRNSPQYHLVGSQLNLSFELCPHLAEIQFRNLISKI